MLKQIDLLLKTAKEDKDVIAAILFGSASRGEEYRDIDIALVLRDKMGNLSMSDKRIKYLSACPDLDIQIFNQLPIYIRQRILKEGKVLLVNNKGMLYDAALETVKAFEDFRPYYEDYLKSVERRHRVEAVAQRMIKND